MNKQLSDQELQQMVQTIADQYGSTSFPSYSPIVRRLLVGLGFITVFIFFFLLLTNLFSGSIQHPKSVIHSSQSTQIVPFEETNVQEVVAPTSPVVIPTVNPVQIPVPPQPSSSVTSQSLPLPIPDGQTEILPLVPPTPLPPSPQPTLVPSDPVKDKVASKEEPKKEVQEQPESPPLEKKSNSIIEIQISKPDEDL